MPDLKKIDIVILFAMVAAHSSYGRLLTEDEAFNYKTIIRWIQDEIASRKDSVEKLLLLPSMCDLPQKFFD